MAEKIIIANWKMNPVSAGEAVRLARAVEKKLARLRHTQVVIAPPFPFLAAVRGVLKYSSLGAQDAFWEEKGAFTGEISPLQLKNLGVRAVIVGHSERRMHLGETDEMAARKASSLLGSGITPILCMGEYESLGGMLRAIPKRFIKNLVIAYEPVWAISTNPGAAPDTPDNALRAMLYIRKLVSRIHGRAAGENVRVIYGGSVNSGNARGFLREGRMDGLLVGGASLKPDEFAGIVRAAS